MEFSYRKVIVRLVKCLVFVDLKKFVCRLSVFHIWWWPDTGTATSAISYFLLFSCFKKKSLSSSQHFISTISSYRDYCFCFTSRSTNAVFTRVNRNWYTQVLQTLTQIALTLTTITLFNKNYVWSTATDYNTLQHWLVKLSQQWTIYN